MAENTIEQYKEPDAFSKVDELLLDAVLDKLCEHGNPSLVRMSNNTWLCWVKAFVTGDGVNFKVMSAYNHSKPTPAARDCYRRLLKALADLGVEVKQ